MESYQKSTIKDELEFINNRLQNAMSLYNKEVKIATLKATPQISKYFEKNMKKFLPTQEFKVVFNILCHHYNYSFIV